MAVKEFKPAKSKVLIKKSYIITLVAFIIVSVFCIGYRINSKAQVAEYETQIAEYEEKIEKLNKENENYSDTLSSGDHRAYYEKIAREVYGYARPGEFVFYSSES